MEIRRSESWRMSMKRRRVAREQEEQASKRPVYNPEAFAKPISVALTQVQIDAIDEIAKERQWSRSKAARELLLSGLEAWLND